MFFSLIVATYGRTDEISRLLHTLAAQSERDFEVLVVDQNADNRLAAVVAAGKAAGLDLRHLLLEKPNLSEARNAGIRQARGDVVGFPDDDCWYETGTLAELRKAFAGAEQPNGVLARWAEEFEARGISDERVLTERAWRSFRGGDASSIRLFFRREVFDRVGMFDVRFGLGCWYGASEETDLVLRVLRAGMTVLRHDAAAVHHALNVNHAAGTVARLRAARVRARGTGGIYGKHSLSAHVVLRGILSPILRPLVPGIADNGLLLGFAIALGRLEGFLRWKFTND